MIDLSYQTVYEFAKQKHEGQFRKDGVTPYITHPAHVAQLVKYYKEHSHDIDVLVASALLHDTLEDTYTSYREIKEKFGEIVASIVMEVSSAKIAISIKGKPNYLKEKMKSMTSYALIIKLCDRLDNLRDVKSLTIDYIKNMIKETNDIIEYLKNNITLTNTQIKLVSDIDQLLDEYKKIY